MELRRHTNNGLVLSWRNINGWTKPTSKTPEKKKLLDNISGISKTGTMAAVISPNGAGKTTLLAIMSGRYKGIVEGEICLNGRYVTHTQMSNICGYVCQKDQTYEYLTVYEHLTFMARLKMGKYASAEDRRKTIHSVVENLSLSHRLHVTIDSLSGGQRKRLTLAVQLLTEPRILFCDEPTTGLDSYNAKRVMQLLRLVANDGKMVICSIHQPTASIFEKFDDVSLLAPGGRLAYHGPVTMIYEYFESLGLRCPDTYNLCEYVVRQVVVNNSFRTNYEVSEETKVDKLVNDYHNSEIYKRLMLDLNQATRDQMNYVIPQWKKASIPWHVEFCCLFWRTLLILKNSYKNYLLRFVSYFLVFSIISWPYGVIQMDQQGVQNMIGFLGIFMLEIIYSSIFGIVNVVPVEIPIFVQESADRLYSPSSFYFSKVIILTIILAIQAFIYVIYAFTVTGLNTTPSDYFITTVPTLLLLCTSTAYGFFLSTAFDSVDGFILFSVPFETMCTSFAGLAFKLTSLPWYISWIKYFSFQYYTYEALNIIEWGKHDYIDCNRASPDQCFHSGDDVLQSLGFSRDHLPIDFTGLIIYFIVLHVLAFIFLRRKLKYIAAY